MIVELRAIRDALRAEGLSAHIGKVPADAPYPTASVQAPGHGVPGEPALCGPGGEVEADFRVVVADETDTNAIISLGLVRAVLSPDLLEARLAVAGRYATTVYVRSEFVGADRSLTLPGTNQHPVVGVDTYRLHSQPA